MFSPVLSTSDASSAASTTTLQTSKSSGSPRKAGQKPQLKGNSPSGAALKIAGRVLVKGGKKKTTVGSKTKTISSKQVPKSKKAGKLPVKGDVKKMKKKPLALQSETPESQPSFALFEQNQTAEICQAIINESVALVKEEVLLESTNESIIKNEEIVSQVMTSISESITDSSVPQSNRESSEESLDGVAVCSENVEGKADEDAVVAPSEDHRDDENSTNVEDVAIKAENFEACMTEDPCRSSESTSSDNPPDADHSKDVQDLAVEDISSSFEPESPEEEPDGEIYVGDEHNVQSCPSKSASLSHEPMKENSRNVEDMDAEDLRDVLPSTLSKSQPESSAEEAMVVPLVESHAGEPENVDAFEVDHDANLDKASEPANTEQTLTEQSGLEDGELEELQSELENVGEQLKTLEVVQEHHDRQLSDGADETRPTETPAQAPEHVHQATVPELESPFNDPEIKTDRPQVQYVGAKKAKLRGGGGKTEAALKGDGKGDSTLHYIRL